MWFKSDDWICSFSIVWQLLLKENSPTVRVGHTYVSRSVSSTSRSPFLSLRKSFLFQPMFYICFTVKSVTLSFNVISAYFPPTARFDAGRLIDRVMSAPKPCLVCGNINAHPELWESVKSNDRTLAIFEVALKLNLFNINDGSSDFIKSTRGSSCL